MFEVLDFITGNKEIIGTVVSFGAGWLGYRWLTKDIQGLFKDGAAAWQTYEKAKADGKFTPDEIKAIADKTGKVAARLFVIWIKIKKQFTKK